MLLHDEAVYQQKIAATRNVETDLGSNPELSLRFGFYEFKEPNNLFEEFEPFLTKFAFELKRKTGETVRIRLMLYGSYELARDALVNKRVDFVRFGRSSYVLAKEMNPDVQLIVKELEKGEPWVPAAIFVKEESKIRSVDDLRGKRIAFGDPRRRRLRNIPKQFL